ncbi:hypothetical protein H9Q10_03635 [Eikenella sp. S3360]|uniref:Uncharacterized protein n=1 Tax=Eikenella glucosivorans TaxID=2766967 RepID=A0ABS0N8X4_9NEIS|nr:hypothetical protein [Eikenella glucosivorans]MBH5328758.1 hypothetical protein [Eikenella glucosivorans]
MRHYSNLTHITHIHHKQRMQLFAQPVVPHVQTDRYLPAQLGKYQPQHQKIASRSTKPTPFSKRFGSFPIIHLYFNFTETQPCLH